MKSLFLASLALQTSFCCAQTIQITDAANTSAPGNQGTSSIGTLACSSLVIDNSSGEAPGQLQQFTISDLDLNDSGGNNDAIVINFRVSSSGEVTTSGTTAAGWLAGGQGNSMDADGESLSISFSQIEVFIDGQLSTMDASFLGFDGISMGSWDYDEVNSSPLDQATINTGTFAASEDDQKILFTTSPKPQTIALSYDSAGGDFGSWRVLSYDFGIQIDSTTPTDPTTPVISAFSADDRSIDPGQTVTLSWNVAGATSLTITPDIGDVTAISTDGVGSTSVTLNSATTYTLSATNAEGTSTVDLPINLRPNKPNVIVILVDDMGTEDCSVDFNLDSSGDPVTPIDPTSVGLPDWTGPTNTHYHTPQMEELASDGTIFSRAYVNPVCSPTRVSFLTGQNSARHRTINFITGGGSRFKLRSQPNLELTAANRTLAEVLRDGGYRTIISGKGHIGDENLDSIHYETPAADPSDDFYGFQINVSATQRGQQGSCYSNSEPAFKIKGSSTSATAFAAEYQDKTYHDLDPVAYPIAHPIANEPVFVTEAVTLEMKERIEDSVDEGKPFFAYLSHFATHAPHDLDPRFADNPKYAGLSGQTLNFATMIEGVDKSIGDLKDHLESLGVAEDTIIIFFGDNGTDSKPRGPGTVPTLAMSNPLRGEKGMRHEGGTRVPFIVSWAKPDPTNDHQIATPIQSGQKESDIVAGQDLFPTICQFANLSLPNVDDAGNPLVIDGVDLNPYLAGLPGTHRPQRLLIHFPTPHRNDFYSILHEQEWKLIYNYNVSAESQNTEVPLGTYELYHLGEDPYESDNRADPNSSNYDPQRVMAMAKSLIEEIQLRDGEFPLLTQTEPALSDLGLAANSNDVHPVILPLIPNLDSDDDFLDDNQEDLNRNGSIDANETDPDDDDTDDDRILDGHELLLGLDPRDGSSIFDVTNTQLENGNLELSWPSLPGTQFTIRSSTDLIDWSNIVAENIDASAANRTTYEVTANSGTKIFYRIELQAP